MSATQRSQGTTGSGDRSTRRRLGPAIRRRIETPGGVTIAPRSQEKASRLETTAHRAETSGWDVPGASSTGPAAQDWRVISKTRTLLIVEQSLEYTPTQGHPAVRVELRLTTAIRGLRKQDGLTQAAYLLRLEIIQLSSGMQVAGFSLGPWGTGELGLERGSQAVPEPLWTAFQPQSGHVHGRVQVADLGRNRILDLPWRTEGILPGPEPFPG
jgi:hypothetical protein